MRQLKRNVQNWEKHTNLIINEELPIDTNNFTMEELVKTASKIATNKAFGPDNIPPEVWKSGILLEPLLKICNHTFIKDKPTIWTKGDIIPFPKKVNLGYTKNYRGITLTCIAAKI